MGPLLDGNHDSNPNGANSILTVPNSSLSRQLPASVRLPRTWQYDLDLGSQLAFYKSHPTIALQVSRRPYVGLACKTCSPESRAKFSEEAASLGLINLLHRDKDANLVAKAFSHLFWAAKRQPPTPFPDVSPLVYNDERVQNAVLRAATQELQALPVLEDLAANVDAVNELRQQLVTAQKRRISQILSGMASNISNLVIRFVGWSLRKLLAKALSAIIIHKGQLETLQKASETGLPLIFLPLHKSHLDYVLITWIFFALNLRAPLVAAGDNLRIPVLGPLLRCLGAFFIQRQLDTAVQYQGVGQKDVLYRAVLQSYVTHAVQAGNSLEFFLEGSRSRTGRPVMPKGGLLSVLFDAYREGQIEDVLLVPVGLSYDVLPEGSFAAEQLGRPKKAESLTGALKTLGKLLAGRWPRSRARLDFGQPFSLKEYVQSYYANTGRVANLGCDSQTSTTSLCSLSDVEKENRKLVQHLACHVVYSAWRSCAITPLQCLASLLLTQYRQGATPQELADAIGTLQNELLYKGYDISWEGEPLDAVNYAVRLMGPGLITKTIVMEKEYGDTETLIKPIIMLPNLLQLAYYAQGLIGPFLLEAITVTALMTLVGEKMGPRCVSSELGVVQIGRNDLETAAVDLCWILQEEFVMTSPCEDLSTKLNETIDFLVQMGLLIPPNETEFDTEDQSRARRIAKHLDDVFGDEDDNDNWVRPQVQLKVSSDREALRRLHFLQKLLIPIMDVYGVTARCLFKLLPGPMEERAFYDCVMKEIQDRVKQKLLHFEESVSIDYARSSTRLLQKWGVVELHSHRSTRVIYLTDDYESEPMLEAVVKKLDRFKA